jgi:hypothetical protein
MTDQVISAIVGGFVILIGIGIVWALILGMKQIGVYIQTTFRGAKYPTPEEMAEFKENAEAVRMAAKAINAVEVAKK